MTWRRRSAHCISPNQLISSNRHHTALDMCIDHYLPELYDHTRSQRLQDDAHCSDRCGATPPWISTYDVTVSSLSKDFRVFHPACVLHSFISQNGTQSQRQTRKRRHQSWSHGLGQFNCNGEPRLPQTQTRRCSSRRLSRSSRAMARIHPSERRRFAICVSDVERHGESWDSSYVLYTTLETK